MKTLTTEDVNGMHEEILSQSGGLPGKCPDRPIESVLFRVFNKILYEEKTELHEVGALYAYAIAEGHPYNDGNKRTAMTAMLVFFELNGISFFASDHNLVVKMIEIADNKISLEGFTRWVKYHIK